MYLKAKPQMLLNHASYSCSVCIGHFWLLASKSYVHSQQSGTLVLQSLLLLSAWQVIMANKKEKYHPWAYFLSCRGSYLSEIMGESKTSFLICWEFQKCWLLKHHFRIYSHLIDGWHSLCKVDLEGEWLLRCISLKGILLRLPTGIWENAGPSQLYQFWK